MDKEISTLNSATRFACFAIVIASLIFFIPDSYAGSDKIESCEVKSLGIGKTLNRLCIPTMIWHSNSIRSVLKNLILLIKHF